MNARIIVIVHLRLDTCNYYNGELVIEEVIVGMLDNLFTMDIYSSPKSN